MARDLLRRYPLFALLDSRHLDGWLAAGQELTFTTGETIFQEGTPGAWAYLVLDGRVRIVRSANTRSDVSLGVVGPGEVFGDYALLPPHHNTATCRASEKTRLLRLPLALLRSFLANYDDLQANLKRWLRLHALLNHLRWRAFLGFMSAPSALKYLDRLQTHTFRALRTIQAHGLADDRWYFIEQGNVTLYPANEPMMELGPGDWFGERALAGWQGLPEAVALTETQCLCLPRAAFESQPGVDHDPSQQPIRPLSIRPSTYPWVGQQAEADCGVAALAMVAQHYKRDVPLEELRQCVRVRGKGLNLLELQRLARRVKLTGQAVRGAPKPLADVTLPAIAHYTDGHYVVLFERSPCRLVIGDPATSILTLSEADFRQHWSGVFLTFRTET
jgi:CRP-like cAMP-binding protein